MPWMYILECADGAYYVGSTWSIEQRVDEHNSGKGAKFTSRRLPVELVFAHYDDSIAAVYALEKRVQGWSRAKREALIRGDFEAIQNAARKRDWLGYAERKRRHVPPTSPPPPPPSPSR